MATGDAQEGNEDLAVRLDANQTLLHYRIIDLLGEGGAGVVYKARDTRLDRVVVVKILKKSLASQEGGRERFLREARLASALDHPNIAGIYNIHEWNGTDFIVMQYVEGVPLNRILAERKMDLPTALSIAIQVTDALAHAHARGIVHRDMKPSNILLTESGQVKILDFGLAKRSDREGTESVDLTRHGQLIGTPLFISPELARGETGDHRSDVFSTGIVLYQLITGKLPFTGANRVEVLHAVTNQEPVRPSLINRKLPPRFDAVTLKALSKRCEDRYQDMKDFQGDLEDLGRDLFQGSGDAPALAPGGKIKFFQRSDARREGLIGRLMEKVFRWSDAGETRAAPLLPDPTRGLRRFASVAVLPFSGVGADSQGADFGTLLSDRISAELGRQGSLAVTPWVMVSAAMQENGDPLVAGHRLGTQTVLTGTFFRTPAGLRLSPQLLRVETGETLWSDSMDLAGAEVFALADQAAARMARVLREMHLGKARSRDETENAEAYECSRRGKYLQLRVNTFAGRRGDLDLAVGLYERAVALDPAYAKAWGELGVCHLSYVLRSYGDETRADQAELHFDKALKLDGELFEPALFRIPLLLRSGRKETARAQWRLLSREFSLDPRLLGMSVMLGRYDGLYEPAVRATHLRDRVWPLAAAEGHLDRGRLLLCQNNARGALEELGKGLAIEPGHGELRAFHALALYAKGDIQQAADLLARLAREDGEALLPRIFLAMCAVRLGNHRQAFSLIDRRMHGFGRVCGEAAYWIGGLYATLLEKPEALTWLHRAVAMGYENYPWFAVDFNLLSLREESGFVSLLAELRQKWTTVRERGLDETL